MISRSKFHSKARRNYKKEKFCSDCGSTERIDIHHKDFNYKNNKMENLQALCHKCHGKKHTGLVRCSICERKHKGRGYCEKHLERYNLWGSPFIISKSNGQLVTLTE